MTLGGDVSGNPGGGGLFCGAGVSDCCVKILECVGLLGHTGERTTDGLPMREGS